MHRILLTIAACAATPFAGAATHANDDANVVAAQQIIRAGTQVSTLGSAENFSGTVRVERLYPASKEIPAAAYVSFEPGARSAWHTHPAGQRLIVVAGEGLTQEWGKPVQRIGVGDVVVCPPGVKHWHGAGPNTAMIHLAISGDVDGKAVEWMEHVATNTESGSVDDPASGPLSAKQQAIPLISAAMASGNMSGLDVALNRGLDAGLSISEAKEILVQLYAYAGFPRSLNALGRLMGLIEARRQRGIEDTAGREPGSAVPTGDALLAVGKANQTRISGAPVEGPLMDFAPVINQFLQAHLFGAIFERDVLDWKSRELATVGALAAMPGVEAQLRSHMRASLRVGLSAEQLRHLVALLVESGDRAAAQRAGEALEQALASAATR
jgi:quercetin dioxygenase-like cupin family protein